MTWTKRAYSPRQQDGELRRIDMQLKALAAVAQTFTDWWASPVPEGGVPDSVAAAWNSTHDAMTALQAHRAWVELNPRVNLTGQEAELARLVSLNID